MIAITPRAAWASLVAVAVAIPIAIPHARESEPSDTPGVIDRIVIHGNTRTRDKVIRRALGFGEAELVVAKELDTARRRLRALGYFMVVAVAARPGSAPGLVTIAIDVVERPQASAGFTSVENFIAVCAISQGPIAK